MLHLIPFFRRREAAKQAKLDAKIREMSLSPTFTIGSVTIVNPNYRGQNPYRGPELADPKNRGNVFIVVRKREHEPLPLDKSNLRVRWGTDTIQPISS